MAWSDRVTPDNAFQPDAIIRRAKKELTGKRNADITVLQKQAHHARKKSA
jgi:hypothetical protein